MFELYSICFCAMLSLSQVDPPKIFVFLCWRLSIIPPLMITGIRDSSNLTNRETAMVNTDQSEEWRVENLRTWEQLQEKCSKNILREWQKNYVFQDQLKFLFCPNSLPEQAWRNVMLQSCLCMVVLVQTVSDKTQDVMSDAAVVLLSSLPQPVCHVLNTEHAFLTHIRYQKIGTYSHTLLLWMKLNYK